MFFKEGATMSILPVIVLPYRESLKKVAFFRLRLINVRFPELNKKSRLVRVSKELSRVIVYVNDARSTARESACQKSKISLIFLSYISKILYLSMIRMCSSSIIAPPSKNDNATCFDADVSADMICRRSIGKSWHI